MPLKKILFRPGVNRENTRYASESLGSVNTGIQSVGGWYECDNVRFRAGTPEKIGGWQRISNETFLGVCRSLWNWVTLLGNSYIGVGTNLKFYVESGGVYHDITPLRVVPAPTINNNPFATTSGLTLVTVTDTAHGGVTGDFVTFSGATTVGGLDLNNEYQITVLTANTYTITAATAASSTATGGGASVVAAYQINVGPEYSVPLLGWGAGPWGSGPWGTGGTSSTSIRLWSQNNFGQNLVFAPRGGGLYYWTAASGLTTRAVLVSSLPGADSEVPSIVNFTFVSDASRFVFAFGCDDYSSSDLNPMLIRWSDQEDITTWVPDATNQAGSLQLSHGSEIITAIQARQEIVVFTDSSVYSLQYVGPPAVWSSQLLGDNTSILGQNAVALASGVVYWMGVDKFYKYDGRVQTLRCDLRNHVFSNINFDQSAQVFASTNEGFNEVWWFYCSSNTTIIDRYVIYNYLENVWYYGNMSRTAWLDSGLRDYPIGATYTSATTSGNLVDHENGVDDNATATPTAIEAYISSSEFDIGDGHNFGFIWRMLPDLSFSGSDPTTTAQLTLTLYPMQNSGSGTGTAVPASVTQLTGASYLITEGFTGQVNTRIRGRQLILKASSNTLGTTWQLGATRIDIRPDGRR